jgi:hypothetical protein
MAAGPYIEQTHVGISSAPGHGGVASAGVRIERRVLECRRLAGGHTSGGGSTGGTFAGTAANTALFSTGPGVQNAGTGCSAQDAIIPCAGGVGGRARISTPHRTPYTAGVGGHACTPPTFRTPYAGCAGARARTLTPLHTPCISSSLSHARICTATLPDALRLSPPPSSGTFSYSPL